jgi:leucyl-tRNA synthetase
MELVNEVKNIENTDYSVLKFMCVNVIKLLAPFVPHISEELWQLTGNTETVFKEKWPEYNEAYCVYDEITLVVQINGKVRGKLDVPADIEEDAVKELAFNDSKIKKYTEDKQIKKMIYIKGKILNIVLF